MLNAITFNNSSETTIPLPSKIVQEIIKLKAGKIDHLIIRGIPISENLADTPGEIRDKSGHSKNETTIFRAIASLLGEISKKGIENTIRFPLLDGKTNTETWHSHFQHDYSILFCLRADERAKVFLESANEIMKECVDEKIAHFLTTPYNYFSGAGKFALIESKSENYEFSSKIFGRSDFEETVKNLDLPDAMKKLKEMQENPHSSEARLAVSYLIGRLEQSKNLIIYQAGDMAIFNEHSTIRFSRGYKPSSKPQHQRWLLAASVKKLS